MPHQMHDAQLDFGLGVSRLDRFRKAGQPIHTGDEDVFDSAVVQLSQDRKPELSSLRLGWTPIRPRVRIDSYIWL
jgi:hypothetical protein